MNSDYDDWYSENAPCSTSSLPSLRSRSSRTLNAAWSVAPWQWMLPLTVLFFLALALVFASGCGSRTIFVPEESPMRVGPSSNLKVYHRVAGEWVLSNNKISIPEGWYLVPPSYVIEDDK